MPSLNYKENSEIAFSVGQILNKVIVITSVNPESGKTEYLCIDSHSGGYWYWREDALNSGANLQTYKSFEDIGDALSGSSYVTEGRIIYAVEVNCVIKDRIHIKDAGIKARQARIRELQTEQARIEKEIAQLQGDG
jgi:hypothetical protein